ncbi:hypothetical protein XENTR_v10021507 [Xenopus tropicalis]|nr:nucleoside diphosphate phosphatase ENTPD5 precursor [Xenopus tropicalis]XP_031746358.1 ectonucleoside triphosphate diphosphohydrolase 5 isoform X2 [Xenopus tropicalis]KAE8585942.1 hypothetical protein XENTR_v10021507 [Xenopus tropicalis]
MKMEWKVSFVFMILAACMIDFSLCHMEPTNTLKSVLPLATSGQNSHSDTIYGIMFDAGSTGTRIHIYRFKQRARGSHLELEGEVFESIKPGLSAFADQPKKGAATVRLLLDLAQKEVPSTQWSHTPVVLKATAGLRLLPETQSDALLSEVREVFRESPFLVPENSVSIINGADEGIFAWITVNFLTGRLHSHRTVGILDLGGGSTQITFLPLTKNTLDQTPHDFLASVELFNSTYRLYTHSYLGLGLKLARLAVLGVSEDNDQQKQFFHSNCFLHGVKGEWSFAGVTLKYEKKSDGQSGFDACYSEILPIIQDKLHQVPEMQHSPFYAFSYYYDRAADANLIDHMHGGVLQVYDFAKSAKEVCERTEQSPTHSHFLCMDLTFITALLKEGFGFEDNTSLQLTKKMYDVEMSWTLGAIFHVLQSLHQQK